MMIHLHAEQRTSPCVELYFLVLPLEVLRSVIKHFYYQAVIQVSLCVKCYTASIDTNLHAGTYEFCRDLYI